MYHGARAQRGGAGGGAAGILTVESCLTAHPVKMYARQACWEATLAVLCSGHLGALLTRISLSAVSSALWPWLHQKLPAHIAIGPFYLIASSFG